jgi:hypothetical protein
LRNKILAQIPASAQSPKLLEELSAIADENYVPDYPD